MQCRKYSDALHSLTFCAWKPSRHLSDTEGLQFFFLKVGFQNFRTIISYEENPSFFDPVEQQT